MSNLTSAMLCPCCSGGFYETCCKPFHDGLLPPTALLLMRSRYSAYSLNLPRYLIKTTHPKNPDYDTDHVSWSAEISHRARHSQFEKLVILEFTETGNTATVTFEAYISQNNQDVSFKEKSYFEKVNGMWLYKSGEIHSI